MNMEEIIKRMKEPFAFEETLWKIQIMNQEKTRGTAVAYLDSRAIQDRLDEVVGGFNWHNQYMLWQENSQICGISIYDEVREEWITKYDGAENTEYEPIKGGLSDSFKRAAVHWGIGRYLYDIEKIWVEIEPKGKSFKIKESEMSKIQNHYINSIHKSSDAPKDKQNTIQSNGETPKNENAYDFKIAAMSESGSSICLQLISGDGNKITAYAKKGSTGLKTNALLKEVALEKRAADFGAYYMINHYELAA